MHFKKPFHASRGYDVFFFSLFCFRSQDFRLGLNTCRTLLHSIKLCSNEFLDPETEEGQELQEKLEVMNHRWEAVCLRAETWRRELQLAIMRSEEFHQSISDLDRKLKECEKSIDKNKPIDLQADQDTLQEAYNLFVVSQALPLFTVPG